MLVGAGYALAAATTSPFSWQADLLTAIPIGVLAVAAVMRWPARPRVRVAEPAAHATHPYRAWVVLLAVVAAWEIVQYAAPGSRALHPTLSSMADAVDRSELRKAAVFFVWMWLGVAIVRAGAARTPVSEADGVTGETA